MNRISMRRLIARAAPPALLGLRRDQATGWMVHDYHGRNVFLKSRRNRWNPRYADWSAREVYYRYYRPAPDHTIVDFGAGFGYEAVYLATRQPGLRWIGVEIQPSVFECLSLTLDGLGENGFSAYPLPVANAPTVAVTPTLTSSDATILGGRSVTLPTTSAEAFMRHHRIERIDFLKMNVEGAETDLLRALDLSKVGEVAISCHDFLAERGLDPSYRTFDAVREILHASGFETRRGSGPGRVQQFWLYGRRGGFANHGREEADQRPVG